MATVHFSDGFESNDFTAWDATQQNENNTIETSGAQPKVGTYGALATIVDALDGEYARLYKKWHATGIGTGSSIFASAWFFFITGFDCEDYIRLIHIHADSSPYNGFAVFMNSSEQLYIYDYVNATTYTQTSPIAVPTNQQVGIELEISVHNTTGSVRLRQDGVIIVEQTGIDTLPASDYTKCYYGAARIGAHDGPDEFYFDEVYIQDSQEIVAGYVRSIADGVGVTDSASRVVVFVRPIADNLDITDALARVATFIRSVADNLGITDVLTRTVGFVRQVSLVDTVGMTDALTRVADVVRSVPESLGITDTLARVQACRRTISDNAGLTDAFSRIVAYARSAAESTGITDTLARVVTFTRSIAESTGVTDALSRIATFTRSMADSVGLTDALTSFHGYVGRFYKETPPSTTWEKAEKPTTEWTKTEKPETEWEKE